VWLSLANTIATSCFLLAQGGPGERLDAMTPSPPPFFLSLAAFPSSPSASLSSSGESYSNRSSPSSAAVPCSPSPAVVLRRSATPPSSSPPNESSRGGQSPCHRRGYLAGNELLRRRNSSSPAILRPRQPPRRVPGELPVRPPPFPSFFLAIAPAMVGRQRCLGAGRPGPLPSRPGQAGRPTWPRAPCQSRRVKLTPLQKVIRLCFYFQKNCCKGLKFVKIIENSPLIRKMCMTYQNVQKNMLYIFVPKSCMLNQL
jgi:hypothetical protein